MRYLAALAGCLLSACAVAQNPVEVAGHRFCVPKDHALPKVAWIKPDGRAVRDSDGIAISNCLVVQTAGRALIKSACLFQPELGSVAIDDDDGFKVRVNDPGFRDSLLGRIALGRDTSRTVADRGRLLVTENQRVWSEWFVWHRKDAQPVDASQPVSDDDELVMTCQKSKSRIGASGGEFREFFECKRSFVSAGLSISYSFESESKVPSLDDVIKMDRSIIDGVGKMKCD
jgi:hypothetical protein